jgi:hypothetical protein
MLNNDNQTPKGKGPGKQLKHSPSSGYGEIRAALDHDACFALPVTGWHPLLDAALQREASAALEGGKVLVFRKLPFTLTREESALLRSDGVAARAGSIHFSPEHQHVSGLSDTQNNTLALEALLKRYAETAGDLVTRLFPGYVPHMAAGMTRLMPLEARQQSRHLKHDGSALHVSAFPSRPCAGKRLLRVYTNISPTGQTHKWRVGDAFENLVARFLPRFTSPLPGLASLMKVLRMTRGLRTPYDHFMLQLNAAMKRDAWYQGECPQAVISFPPGSSWIVFSDQVPHATIAGQQVLEQTFMVSPEGLDDPDTSPLHVMEKIMRRRLA